MIGLIGASGYIGQAFARHFLERGIEFAAIRRRDVDYYQARLLRDDLSSKGVSFVINCAGYTGKPNVDACEDHKAECLLANAVLPGAIAEACREMGIPWGHVSSGCIFEGDGPSGAGFRETDPPNFCFRGPRTSFYSGSKALGEEVIGDVSNCYVWRMRMPFSNIHEPRNYLSKLLRYEWLVDVRNSLSDLDEFILACIDCWERQLPMGIYHLTCPGSITTREVVTLIVQVLQPRRVFQFFDSEDEFLKRAARTPRSNCTLDVSKALSYGLRLTDVRVAIRRALENWKAA